MKLCRDEAGGIQAKEIEEESDRRAFDSYKAERLLHLSARSLSLAGWGQPEAFTKFYECVLEEFWASPLEGFSGPSVEDVRKCEMAALKQAVRLMLSSKCTMEDALHTTVFGDKGWVWAFGV